MMNKKMKLRNILKDISKYVRCLIHYFHCQEPYTEKYP